MMLNNLYLEEYVYFMIDVHFELMHLVYLKIA